MELSWVRGGKGEEKEKPSSLSISAAKQGTKTTEEKKDVFSPAGRGEKNLFPIALVSKKGGESA